MFQVFAYPEAVDDHLNGVLFAQFQAGNFVDFPDSAIHADPHKALGPEFFKQLHVFALAVAHHWREQHDTRTFRQGQHLVDHLADRLCLQGDIVVGAARCTHAGEQQPQVIIYLGDGPDG